MGDAIVWFLSGMWSGVTGLLYVLTHLGTVLNFSEPANVLQLVFYGASVELFFVFFNTFLIVFIVGIFLNGFLWKVVIGLETIANVVGRVAAWAGLLMVLQQTMVVFLQSIFRVAEISVGPFGLEFTQTVGWYSDSLKNYNANDVCLC